MFGRTPPAYGHVLQTKLQHARKQPNSNSNDVIMSHYDFLSSLKLKDERISMGSKHLRVEITEFPNCKRFIRTVYG